MATKKPLRYIFNAVPWITDNDGTPLHGKTAYKSISSTPCKTKAEAMLLFNLAKESKGYYETANIYDTVTGLTIESADLSIYEHGN